MTEAETMSLESELGSWRQLLRQADDDMAMHDDGWMSDDDYAEVSSLRDRCRAEMARIEEVLHGTPPSEKVGTPIQERVTTSEDALIDIAELVASNEVTLDDVISGLMELAEIVSGGDE